MNVQPLTAPIDSRRARGLASRRLALVDSRAMRKGGVERTLMILAKGLMDRHESVRVIISKNDRNYRVVEWLLENDIAVECAPELETLNVGFWKGTWSLYKLFKSINAEVINFHSHSNQIWIREALAARLSGAGRVVATVHHAVSFSSGRDRLKTRIAAMFCNDVIVTTEFMRRLLHEEAGIGLKKLRVVGPAVPAPTEGWCRAAIRERLGLPEGAFVIGTLARLFPNKGISDLIQAVAQMPQAPEGVVLVVGGTGPEMDALQAEARERLPGREFFLGDVQDVADVYGGADLFVLPSYEEGFGLVYIEAALYGLPSIGARVGGVPEAVLDGETGLLVPPGQIDALSEAMQRLRTDPSRRRSMGEAAKRRAESEFSIAAMVDAYEAILYQA